jgi:hypothetical protein
MIELLPPFWVIRVAVAIVWVYEGLWCKLIGGDPHQLTVVQAVPGFAPGVGALFLKALGVVELGVAAWSLSGAAPIPCAVAQTLLLVALNTAGLVWARRIIHDPGGMVAKNFAFLVLAWVSASLPRWI